MQTAEAPPAIADPAPLGLAGFGTTTLMLSIILVGLISPAGTGAVLGMAAAFGGTAQFLAGMWAFRRGNTFAATAFSSFGAFWWSFYLINVVFASGLGTAAGPVLGLYVATWGLFTFYMFIASLHTTRAVQSVFLLLFITYFLLAFGYWNWFGIGTTFTHVGGGFGIATAIAALYTSFADVLNASARRVILRTN
ncbi:MAG: acetate uptake transporter [Candidatus Dormibacteria bacterium]